MAKFYYDKYQDNSTFTLTHEFYTGAVPTSYTHDTIVLVYRPDGNTTYPTTVEDWLENGWRANCRFPYRQGDGNAIWYGTARVEPGNRLPVPITKNGIQIGSMYFDRSAGGSITTSYITTLRKGQFIERVIAEEGIYPDNAPVDGIWYVKKEAANIAPTISGRDLDLGGIKQPFNHSYSIDDKDTTQELSITIAKSWLSSSETIGNAVRNQNYITGISQDEFNSLELNAQHKITITVTDGAGAQYSRYISFRRINTAPTVTVNRDMGEQNAPFDITYRVTDLENDTVNVEFLYEGKVIGNQSNVDKETGLTWSIPNLEYIKMPNGYSEITIRAIDVNGASSASLVGFTKNVHGCGIEHGIEVDEVVDFCIADCKRELAKELDEQNVEILKVQACNNYGDDSPNWEDVPLGKIHRFVNKTAVNTPKVGVRFEVLSDPQIGNSYLSNFVFKWGWEE